MNFLQLLAVLSIAGICLLLWNFFYIEHNVQKPPYAADKVAKRRNAMHQATNSSNAVPWPALTASPIHHTPPLPPIGSTKGPYNILFLFPDSWRADFDGFHSGLPVRLPHLRQLAAQGVRFRHAFTPSPLCTPARSALISGREYDQCGVPDNAHNYPLSQTTFYTQLRKAGFEVMTAGKDDLSQLNAGWARHEEANARALGFTKWSRCFGKMDTVRVHGHVPWEIYGRHLDHKGLWRRHKGDFMHRTNENEYFNFEPTFLAEEDYQDNWIGRKALEMLQEINTTRPWFLQVNYAGPHPPLDVTETMKKSVQNLTFTSAVNCSIDPERQHWMRRLYAAQMENIDWWTGQFMQHLTRSKQLDRTLVCISSDHGEMLGDHTMLGKECPFQGAVGVPLVCRGPGLAKGLVIHSPVTILDLAATFLHYGQAEPLKDMTSVSLHDVFEGRSHVPPRSYVLSGFGYFRTVTYPMLSATGAVTAIYKLICCKGRCHRPYHTLHWKRPTVPSSLDAPMVLLFDILQDPGELHDLSTSLPAVAQQLSNQLHALASWDCQKPLIPA